MLEKQIKYEVNKKPVYSICICNYNMADTLEEALLSILEQIDDDYEILVIDDGSSDSSVKVLEQLADKYPLLRFKALPRDKRRLLGETRNISIREARGEYVLPQFDCDDVYQACIRDFVQIYHQLSSCVGHDFYLKGNKLNMGRKEFLLKHGPYRNMFKEDRDMWIRLASVDALLPLVHKQVHIRLPKTHKQRLVRLLFKTWAHLQADYRAKLSFSDPYKKLFSKKSKRAYKVRLLRCLYAPFAYVTAAFMEPLTLPDSTLDGKLRDYWLEKQGSFQEIMERYGGQIDISLISTHGRKIFLQENELDCPL